MRDMASDLSGVALFVPGVLSATPAAVPVDLSNFEATTIYFTTGIGGIVFSNANRIDLSIQHSDDNATFINVVSTDLVGAPVVTAGVVQSYQAAKPAATLDKFGYKGSKRYLQAVATFVGAHATGTPVAGVAVRGFPLKAPVT
jgi:hypothetical protein